jgi:hypothetical protein
MPLCLKGQTMAQEVKIIDNLKKDVATYKLLRRADFVVMIMFVVSIASLYLNYYAITVASVIFMFIFQIMEKNSKRNEFEKDVIELGTIKNYEQNKFAQNLGYLLKRHYRDLHTPTNFLQSLKKILGMEYAYNETKSNIRNAQKSNVIAPVLLSDVMLREHIATTGTTGSGKTRFFLSSQIDSQIKRGGGVLAVFGKSDNEVVQLTQSLAAKYNRLHEVLIYDFASDREGRVNSNKINLFEIGNAQQTTTILLNIAGLEGEKGDTWVNAAKSFFGKYCKFIFQLRDSNFVVDPQKIEDVYHAENDKFVEYEKNLTKLDFYTFYSYLTDKTKLLMLLELVDHFYEIKGYQFDEFIYAKSKKNINEEFESNVHLATTDARLERNQFHETLKQEIIIQCAVPSWKDLKLCFKGKLDNLLEEYRTSQGAFYKLDVSISQYTKLADFFDQFPAILKNRVDDANILDAIDQNRIVIVNIPGQNKQLAPLFADLVMSLIDILVERRGKAHKSDTTLQIILDEVNSWLKNKKQDEEKGVGNLMSVARGLNISFNLGFQSDLKETMKSTEASQMMSNANTIIALKTVDKDIRKALNEQLPKVRRLVAEETAANAMSENSAKSKQNNQSERIKYTEKEEDFFADSTLLERLKNGEGYIIRQGVAKKFITHFANIKNIYKKETDAVLLNRYVSAEQIQKQLKENR